MKGILSLTCLCTMICSLEEIIIWHEKGKSSEEIDIIEGSNITYSSKASQGNYGAKFNCLTSKPSSYTRAQSVHSLTPYDVDIVAGIGDSMTAGFGAGAKSISAFPLDYRGLSWSAGGDKTLKSVTTLPNILKKYNPSLIGYSTGVSLVFPKNFNVAMAWVQTSYLIYQAESLVEKMDRLLGSRQVVDSKWKIITIMAGFNDICFNCGGTILYHANIYVENIKKVLEYLSANVKKAFVNIVLPPDPGKLKTDTNGFRCSLIHMVVCPCLIMNATIGSQKQKMFGIALQQLLVDKSHYNREDFTVVLQPFFYNTPMPKNYDDYFGLDCAHPNKRGHALSAFYLWNNMLEPLGAKTDNIDWENVHIFKCPSEESPYFYTSLNSGNFSLTPLNSTVA